MQSLQRMWLLEHRPSLNRQRYRWTARAVWEGRREVFGEGSQSAEILPTRVYTCHADKYISTYS